MDKVRKKKLEEKGWKFGGPQDLLGLSDAEMRFIDARINVRRALAPLRKRAGLTQAQVAKMMESSQSRISKLEGGDPDASLDLMIRAFFTCGGTPRELGRVISGRPLETRAQAPTRVKTSTKTRARGGKARPGAGA